MSLTRSIARNTSIHLAGKLACLFFNIIVFSLTARYLGRAGFGEFTTVIAFLQMFAIFSDLGLYMIFIQMLSSPGADEAKITGNFIVFRLASSIILLSLAPLAAWMVPQYSLAVKIGILITTLYFLAGSFIQLLTGFFQTKLQIIKVVYAEVISRVVLVALVWWVIYAERELPAILSVFVISGLINAFILYFFARRLVKISWQVDWKFWRDIFQKTWPVGLAIIFTTIYFKGDTVILSLFKSQEEVGIYGAAYRILEALIVFPPLFMGLVLPHLTRSWAERSFESFKKIFQRSFNFFVIIILFLIIMTMFLARPLMVLVAGPGFAISAIPFKILIFATSFIFLGALATYAVIALEEQRRMLKFYFISMIVALAGYFVFIPRYSYFGAAYTTVIVEFLTTAAAFWVIWRRTNFFPSLGAFWRALPATLITGLFLAIFKSLNLFLLISLAILVYGFCIYFFKAISREFINEIIKSR